MTINSIEMAQRLNISHKALGKMVHDLAVSEGYPMNAFKFELNEEGKLSFTVPKTFALAISARLDIRFALLLATKFINAEAQIAEDDEPMTLEVSDEAVDRLKGLMAKAKKDREELMYRQRVLAMLEARRMSKDFLTDEPAYDRPF